MPGPAKAGARNDCQCHTLQELSTPFVLLISSNVGTGMCCHRHLMLVLMIFPMPPNAGTRIAFQCNQMQALAICCRQRHPMLELGLLTNAIQCRNQGCSSQCPPMLEPGICPTPSNAGITDCFPVPANAGTRSASHYHPMLELAIFTCTIQSWN